MSDFSVNPSEFPSSETPELSLPITADMTEDMHASSKWVQFLGVISIGVSIIMAFAFLISIFLFGYMSDSNFSPEAGIYVVLTLLVFFVIMSFYVFISFLLYKYGDALRTYASNGTQSSLEGFFTHQRKFWQTAGITTTIFLVVYFIFLAFVLG